MMSCLFKTVLNYKLKPEQLYEVSSFKLRFNRFKLSLTKEKSCHISLVGGNVTFENSFKLQIKACIVTQCESKLHEFSLY